MFFALLVILVVLFVVLPLIGMALWALVTTVVVGLIIGALGRLIVPGHQPIGFLATLAAGLSGSIIGGFVGQHVLGAGHLVTILIEIVISALTVVVISRSHRGNLPRAQF
jgi:uncharacterized membrane protein YeaQ/YmgE (transglycosylase-associated protein family)